jgi:hypothetical protein
MGYKKNKKIHESFESSFENGRFIKFCDDMEQSIEWKELSLSQIGLYHVLKAKFTKYKDGTNNANNISFTKSEWSKYYTRKEYFDRDMDRLIELGFIKVILYQGNCRKPTIYGFSEQWKYYGTDKFKITDKDRRPKDTLSEEHKKSISRKVKENNEKRYRPKVIKLI